MTLYRTTTFLKFGKSQKLSLQQKPLQHWLCKRVQAVTAIVLHPCCCVQYVYFGQQKVETLYPSPKVDIQNLFFIPTTRKIWFSLTMQQGFYMLRASVVSKTKYMQDTQSITCRTWCSPKICICFEEQWCKFKTNITHRKVFIWLTTDCRPSVSFLHPLPHELQLTNLYFKWKIILKSYKLRTENIIHTCTQLHTHMYTHITETEVTLISLLELFISRIIIFTHILRKEKKI